ncbi:hypothetical protein Esti_006876 [Eimeria stiedai]
MENWCILCDLNGTSIASFPLPLLFKLIQLIQGAYRGRLYRFYILHAPRLFHFVAKPLLASLPSSTAKKIRVFTQLDDWHQERRTQFADHQLEKKFGGTAPDITENWYPFHFFPGPFEPGAVSSPSGEGEKAVIRWKSERSLHARVHPSVHTGASLHTSLLWRRPIKDQGRESACADEAQTLRYAAWLHHLPELHLLPKAIHWARVALRGDLLNHHHHLLQHLQDRPQEEAHALSSCAGQTAPDPLSKDNVYTSLSNSSTRDASRMPTPPRGRSFVAAAAAVVAPAVDRFASAMHQQTTAAAQDEGSPTKSSQRGSAAASPVGNHQGLCEAALPEQACPGLSPAKDPAALAAPAAAAAAVDQPQEQGPASLATEGSLHQQLLPGCSRCALEDSCPAASQSGGHWTPDRPLVTAERGSAGDAASCTLNTSAAAVPAFLGGAASCLHSSGESALRSAQGRLSPCRGCGRETLVGSCGPAACRSRAASPIPEQQLAVLTLREDAADPLLSHPPHSPLMRSAGCPCRTMSLSGVETAERLRGVSPVPPGWQEAPVCERSYAESCHSGSCGPPMLPQLQPRAAGCSGDRRANSCCSSTLPPLLEAHEAHRQAPIWIWEAAPVAAFCSSRRTIGAVSCGEDSARGPLVQALQLTRFVPPVVAEASPSTSAFLPTISSSSESCLAACSDLHPGSPGPAVRPVVTPENPLGDGGLSSLLIHGSEVPLSAKGHRSLGRMVRAIYKSVSRSNATSGSGGGPEEMVTQQLPPKKAIRRRQKYAERWHRRVDRHQQAFDKRRPAEGRRRRLGLSMRLRGKWLSRQLQAAAAATPAAAPKAATAASAKPGGKGRSRYSRLRLSRRRLRTTPAAARLAAAQHGEPLVGSGGGCGVWTAAARDSAQSGTPSSPPSYSHSICLLRLPHSISAHVKRGSLVLVTRMHRKRSAPGGST